MEPLGKGLLVFSRPIVWGAPFKGSKEASLVLSLGVPLKGINRGVGALV